MPSVIPDWVTLGSEVLVYTDSSDAPLNVQVTTIGRITATGFTTTNDPTLRYRFAAPSPCGNGYSVLVGGKWGNDRVVVPLDSPPARRQLAAHNRRVRIRAADRAYDAWKASRTEKDLTRVIASLEHLKECPT